METKIILEKVKKVVIDFLKENGGMSNGYTTTLDGIVENDRNGIYDLKWYTPKCGELTINEHEKMAKILKKDIYNIIKDSEIYALEFESRHIEYGCSRISVKVIESKSIISW